MAFRSHRTFRNKNRFIALDSYYRPGPPVIAITAGVIGVILTVGAIYSVMKRNEADIRPIPVQPYKPSNQINS